MARLTQDDVSRLVKALEHKTSFGTGDSSRPPETLNPAQTPSGEEARKRLQELESSGALGPYVTQRLAAYLGKPVRCTCVATPIREASISFSSRAGDALLWLRMEHSLASMLGDAMLGGEGNPRNVGFNARVERLAAASALEMLRAMAGALNLPEPAAISQGVETAEAVVSGVFGLALEEHAWEAGVTAIAVTRSPVAQDAPALVPASIVPAVPEEVASAHAKPPIAQATAGVPDLDSALESARLKLTGLVGAEVGFERQTVLWLTGGNVPHGWIRLGLASHGGGALVLAADRTTALAIVHTACGGADLDPAASGLVLETGAEVILRETLCALAAALGSAHEELHHVVRLTDDAIVPDLPHVGVEHDLTWGGQSGHLRWLVPAHLVRPLADQLSKS